MGLSRMGWVLVGALLLGAVTGTVLAVYQSQLPIAAFRLEWRRHGGVASLDERLVVADTGAITFSSNRIGGGELRFRISRDIADALRDFVETSGFFDVPDSDYRARLGAADYYSYELGVSLGDRQRTIRWVDTWAAATPLPPALVNVQQRLETFKERQNLQPHVLLRLDGRPFLHINLTHLSGGETVSAFGVAFTLETIQPPPPEAVGGPTAYHFRLRFPDGIEERLRVSVPTPSLLPTPEHYVAFTLSQHQAPQAGIMFSRDALGSRWTLLVSG